MQIFAQKRTHICVLVALWIQGGTDAHRPAMLMSNNSTMLGWHAQQALKRMPKVVTTAEYAEETQCSFLDQNGQPASCTIEKPEHTLVNKYVKPGMVVLELGARYGTTTCAIAAQLQNSGKLVAVEPDQLVWSALDQNLQSHDCQATVLKGVVGTQERHIVTPSGYGTRTALAQLTVPSTSFVTLEAQLGQPFDAMLIDCEGCVETFLAENPTALDNIKVIMLEGDMGVYSGHMAPDCGDRCVKYDELINSLITSHGFELMEANTDSTSCCPWIHHFALQKK